MSECRRGRSVFPRARAVAGELHLIRVRVESLLADVGERVAEDEHLEEWLRVEGAARLARRALVAAGGALPPLPPTVPHTADLRVGLLRVDPPARRQWYGETEFALTPLHHQLLAVLAGDPYRVFSKGELVSAVWRDGGARSNAVNTSVSRLRRALVAAGAPPGAWLLSVHGGRLGAHPPGLAMHEIFDAYLAAQRRRRASPLTLKSTAHALRTTQRWLDGNGIDPAKLTLLQCEEYFDALLEQGAVSTVRRHLAYLRAADRYAVRHELCDRDPTADVKLPRLPDNEPATYTNDELRQIHAAIASERDELAFYLFAFAGLRLGEVAALVWRQVDFAHWQIKLHGKGGKFRLVPLHPVLQDVLREHRPRRTSEEATVLGAAVSGRPIAARTLAQPFARSSTAPRSKSTHRRTPSAAPSPPSCTNTAFVPA
jgi:site-specific recombinase XerD